MYIYKKTVKLYGGSEIQLLTPYKVDYNIISGHDNKGFVVILGNGSGYHYLKECLLLAANIKKNEILHLPIHFNISQYEKNFIDYSFNRNMYLVNYCETQISPKDIDKISGIKVSSSQTIERFFEIREKYIESWKTNRRLTVKNHKKNMIISTNRDGFINLAYGVNRLANYGDDVLNVKL